ncbi:polymorphic toxin-type HINT domain-containing protein [Dactylosporangium sp. NPDC050688]|uniref:polymorphic toxin-type HINT domain-containing protein n=1 Tax=Dactylosporangium sp. NPDC050688 TaxID=3157217 RepID=UPI0033F61C2C
MPAVLQTTQHHPFWDKTSGAWVQAGQLEVGHQLLTSDGSVRVVVLVVNATDTKVMRDLTVATFHTYYVQAVQAPVLVHNCGDGVPCTCYPATGYGPNVPPIRHPGVWSTTDIWRAARWGAPPSIGTNLELHHADQMLGSAIRELERTVHRGPGNHARNYPNANGVLPPFRVTGDDRDIDTPLHWWYRAMEEGWTPERNH